MVLFCFPALTFNQRLRQMKPWLLCLIAGMSVICLRAQTPLITDRPDQTEASATVGKGIVQIETGMLWETTEGIENNLASDQTEIDVALTLLRIGLTDMLEARIEWGYHSSKLDDTKIDNGMGPMRLGVKMDIAEEQGAWPEIAFIGHVTLPGLGEAVFAPAHAAPDFRFSFAHQLSNTWSLGYNLGMEWDGINPEASGIYTLVLGAGLTEKLGAFVELFGSWPEGDKSAHNFDFGMTAWVMEHLQLDVSYGLGLTDNTFDNFLSFGFSWRIPAWE